MTEKAKSVMQLYSRIFPKVSFGTSLFLRARWHATPYARMTAELPRAGRILDLGCGHGLLSLALALESPAREVLGVDHDEERVKLAQEVGASLPNLRFEKGSALSPPEGTPRGVHGGVYDGIALIDVMHYFPPEEQKRMVDQAFASLAKGSTLLVREVNPEGGAVSRWNRLYEKIATRTGFTQADKKELHFRSPEAWKTLFRDAGFLVSSAPCSHFLFADILYVCKKPH